MRANQEWAMDFIVDGLSTGRMVRILSVVDAFTRECLALEADSSLGSDRVTRVIERLIEERGKPEAVRSDNGPEFTSRRMLGWAEDHRVALVHIQPGRPMQNGHVESFYGRLRDECLNVSWFRNFDQVRSTLQVWRMEYNEDRLHSALDYRTSNEFRRTLEERGAMAPLLRRPQPSAQLRNSSYEWLRKRGHVRLMPPLFLQLWRELHPKAHEQTALNFTQSRPAAKVVPLFKVE